MKTIGIIAVGIMFFVFVVFLIATNNWDKKKEQGGSMQKSEEGDAIAKFFLYLFIVAFIAANLVVMKDCSEETDIPFEETIRHS